MAAAIWREYYVSIISSGQIHYMVDKFQSASAITDHIQEQGYEYFFIQHDRAAVGYLAVKEEEGKLFLSKFYIIKEHRGYGYASKAMAFLEGLCKKRGLTRIWLTVNRHNEASIAVYEKKGFRIVREQIADIGNGFVMDDYIMEKDISAASVKSVIVIGAGILGASTAYQLAKMGAKVLIIDRQDQGQATDAAAGIICPWLSQRRNKAWYRLAKAGAGFYPGLIEELTLEGETETGYAKVGALSIHDDLAKIAKLEERAQQRQADAPEIGEITRLDPQETIARFPLLADGHSSVHISGAARVDGRALRDALIRSAQRHGAAFIRGDAVIRYEANRAIGAAAGGEYYTADAVIVCAGAWARQLLQPLGISFKVGYQKAQIMHVLAADQYETGSWPVVMPPSDQYLLAFDNRRIVIGATHEDDVDGYDTRITAGGMQEILDKGMMAAPGLKNTAFQEVRVGFRPYTPGYLPVIGQIPGWEGLYAANGLGASGLTTGPFIGCQLAKLALGMEADMDLNDYDIRNAIEAEQAGLKMN